MVLNLTEVLEFKAAMAEKGIVIHLHDTCGGQYFSLDETGEAVVSEIEGYFAARPQHKLVFEPKKLGFYILDK